MSRILRLASILTAALWTLSCGGRSIGRISPDPETAAVSFLEAVKANNIAIMAELFGTTRGPAVTYMDPAELQQRLTVIRAYLVHDEFEIVTDSATVPLRDERRRMVRVRLGRGRCLPVVPFTMVRVGQGWLVEAIDLAAAGNPVRNC